MSLEGYCVTEASVHHSKGHLTQKHSFCVKLYLKSSVGAGGSKHHYLCTVGFVCVCVCVSRTVRLSLSYSERFSLIYLSTLKISRKSISYQFICICMRVA